MNNSGLTPVHFQPKDGTFVAMVPMDALLSGDFDLDNTLTEASRRYVTLVTDMRSKLNDIKRLRSAHIPVPARSIWALGDAIFKLNQAMSELTLQIDSLYSHLSRDLSVKRKWLEKVVIFRRYLAQQKTVPPGLNWGRCEKGTRRVAENLSRGILPQTRKAIAKK